MSNSDKKNFEDSWRIFFFEELGEPVIIFKISFLTGGNKRLFEELFVDRSLLLPKFGINESDSNALEKTKNQSMNTVFVAFGKKETAIEFLNRFENKIAGFDFVIFGI